MNDDTVQLHHFTNLINFPAIHREGITIGEVPISPTLPYNQMPSAANLTTNGNRADQYVWARNQPTDKTALRLTVEMRSTDLTSFREIKEKYQMRSSWLKVIAPYEHRRHWFFAMNGVKPEQIVKIELSENGQYRRLTQREAQELIALIEAEAAEKLEVQLVKNGLQAGAREYRVKPGYSDTWLFDGPKFRAAHPYLEPAYPWRNKYGALSVDDRIELVSNTST